MRIPTGIRSGLTRLCSASTIGFFISANACGLAMYIQTEYRVPGSFVFLLLPWVGLALGALSFIFLVTSLAGHRITTETAVLRALGRIQWWAGLLILVFVCYSVFLYANGKLDSSLPVDRRAEVLEIVGEEIDLGSLVPYTWAELRLRDDPGRPIRLFLESREERNLWGGEAVIVQEREGYFGLPWIAKIDRDKEYYARETLRLMPTAAAAWREIVDFYLEHQRWREASTAALAYLEVYPHDYDFALYAGAELTTNRRYAEGIPLLELVVERKPSYEAYQALGWALSYSRNNVRAAQVLEASLALDPDDFQAYYHLGYVYTGLNRYADAIAMFEKVLERQPNMPEANAEITKLRRLLATQQQTGERKK